MRVLIFHPALAPYRALFFRRLSKYLQLRLVFSMRNTRAQRFDQKSLLEQMNVQHGFLTRGVTLLGRDIRWGMGREIAAFNPDVVVTQEFSPVTVFIAFGKLVLGKQYRHVVWTDDSVFSVQREHPMRTLLRKLIMPRLDGLVVLSDEVATLYRQQFKARIPVGVSPLLQPEGEFRDGLAEATGRSNSLVVKHGLVHQRVVLFVGRLVPAKRVDLLLCAFALLRKKHPDVRLVLVGDGPERTALETQAECLSIKEAVLFAGRQVGLDLLAWYRLGGVFALASEFEPFGAVVNEALLSGMPVVCSKYAGARVLVRPGENGFVIDPFDSQVFSDAIETCLFATKVQEATAERPSLMAACFSHSVDAFVGLLKQVEAGF